MKSVLNEETKLKNHENKNINGNKNIICVNILGMEKITLDRIRKLDKSLVYESVLSFPKQIEHTLKLARDFSLPDDYKNIRNVVVAGMGGSALGARLGDSLEYKILKVPLEIVNDYHLPSYVDENTLVIASSYSGTTEETLSCYQEARKLKARVLTISSGGELADLAHKNGFPGFVFKPQFNPSNQPRLGIGYSTISLMLIMSKLDLISLTPEQIGRVISAVEKSNREHCVENADNPAVLLAGRLKDRIPVLIAAEHLYEATHTTKNQINENAKTFSAHFAIPELNHHLMEGLKFPQQNKEVLFFILYVNDLYHPRIQRRFKLTKQLVEKAGIPTFEFIPQSQTRLEQVFEVIQFGNFYSFYLAILNGLDPAPIPTVDWFKKEMEKE